MSEFKTVAKVGAIPKGEGRTFTVDGRVVGVFLIDGEYFAINDLCPHMGASLARGHVEDHAVTCPWHAWRYSVRDGTWLDNPRGLGTDSWPARLDGDSIQVAIPARDPAPDAAEDTRRCSSTGESDDGKGNSPDCDSDYTHSS